MKEHQNVNRNKLTGKENMQITIDTNKDSIEDIKRVIELLNQYTGSKFEKYYNRDSNDDNQASEKESEKKSEIDKTTEENMSPFKEQLLDEDPINNNPEIKEKNQSTSNHTNLMPNFSHKPEPTATNVTEKSVNTYQNTPTAMKANPGTPPDFTAYLELLKNKQEKTVQGIISKNNQNNEKFQVYDQ